MHRKLFELLKVYDALFAPPPLAIIGLPFGDLGSNVNNFNFTLAIRTTPLEVNTKLWCFNFAMP